MQPQIRSAALEGYREICASLGVDPIAMMRAEGLDPTCLNDPDRRVAVDSLVRLFERTAQVANAPDLGLRLAAARPFSIMGPLSLAARDEPTVRGAFQVMIRYLHVHNEGVHIRMSEADGMATVDFILTHGKPMAVPVSSETAVAVTAKILKAFIGSSWTPIRVLFEHDAPKDIRPHRQFFGCPVKFSQFGTALHIRSADLDLPNRMSDAGLAPYGRRYLRELVESADVTLADRVGHLIRLEISSGRCSVQRVAQSLGVTRRTLHRQLAEEQTTYSELFTSVRKELALRYVVHTNRSLHEIAEVLGYSELSAFSRWYKKQFGVCPSASREHAESSPAPSVRRASKSA
jgi:AraC-like DNA-binding protein